ncbi:MAG TPA: VCBS repeat-containing protein, partial [Candidatus Eisenbacteria bacterium]
MRQFTVSLGLVSMVGMLCLWPAGTGANVPTLEPGFRAFDPGVSTCELVVADLDNDDRADLVAASWQHPVILWAGDNGLYSPQALTTGAANRSVAVADFDEDGTPDLAVANGGAESVDIWLGTGSGFTFLGFLDGVDGAYSIRSADFDADGHADLAVTNGLSGGFLAVGLGNGDGTFSKAALHPAGNAPTDLEIADLNADGAADIVVANADAGIPSVSVYIGAGDGSFLPSPQLVTGPPCFALVVADFDG